MKPRFDLILTDEPSNPYPSGSGQRRLRGWGGWAPHRLRSAFLCRFRPAIFPLFRLALLSLLLGQEACLYRKPWFDDAPSARAPADLPPLPSGPALRVLVIGDFGTGESGQREVAEAISRTHAGDPPDLVLTVGDNFYPRGVESVDDPLWESVFEDVYSGEFWGKLVFHPTLGNHDVMGEEEAQAAYSETHPRWRMPAGYYSFRQALPSGSAVRFLALDTNALSDGGEGAQRELAWLDSLLVSSSERWIVAYGHHPMVTGGWHGSNETVRQLLEPRFEGRVPIFLSGHNHSIELLRLSRSLFQGVCGGGAGRDNAYRVDSIPGTLSSFSNGGWCLLHFWPDTMAVELYNRVGTLRARHLIPSAGVRLP